MSFRAAIGTLIGKQSTILQSKTPHAKNFLALPVLKNDFTLKSARSMQDLSIYKQVCKEQGWLLGKHDLELFYATDPTGYYIGYLQDQPVSIFSFVKYGHGQLSIFGMLGVLQGFQNRGFMSVIRNFIGNKVHDKNMCAFAFAVPEVEENRVKNFEQFSMYTAWVDYEFTFEAKEAASILNDPLQSIALDLYQEPDFGKLLRYDSEVFNQPRRSFLETLVNLPSCTSIVASIPGSGEIVGYCAIRETTDDEICYFSPWFANDVTIAQVLLKKAALFASERNDKIKFKSIMPCINEDGIKLVQMFSPQVDKHIRLCIGSIPEGFKNNSKKRVFGISSPCLG
uniref:YitH/HolE acetyltransferase (GNAT) domain-containing protein n=1 Tax=Amphimedon queenslandica TaxID=400682 RepID=A0A1X7UXQ6_AMPQE